LFAGSLLAFSQQAQPEFDQQQCRPSGNADNASVALWRGGHGAGNGVRQRRAEFKPTTEASTVDFDKELDARGLSCPLPILKTKKSLNELTSGQVLKVVATDPGSIKDMQAFATQTGNPLLSTSEENKTYVFFLRKK
jgi:tRNA 2-thiouridine synthesizing protein A